MATYCLKQRTYTIINLWSDIKRTIQMFSVNISAAVRIPVKNPEVKNINPAAENFDSVAENPNTTAEDVNSAAARLLDTHGNRVLRMAYSYLHNMSDAEEILQETLIKYIQTRPALENFEHEKAWLLRVAANLSKNRIKYNQLRDTDELNEQLEAQDREDLSFVWEAVKALPPKQCEVIHLFYYEGYKTAQIAEVLKRNESSVRSDLKRGREKLKEILKEEYDFEG